MRILKYIIPAVTVGLLIAGSVHALSVSLPSSIKKGDMLVGSSTNSSLYTVPTSTQGSVWWMGSNGLPAWTATSTLGITGGGSGVTGGTNGYAARFTSPTALSTGLLLDNGTVAGVNATSSSYTFNLQGSSGVAPLNVASSTGTSILQVTPTARVGLNTTTPGSTLSVKGISGTNLFEFASSTNESLMTLDQDGNFRVGKPLTSANFNTFDILTSTAKNFFLCKDPVPNGGQTCTVALSEYSTTTNPFSGGLYGQGTAVNATGSMPFLYGVYGESDTFTTGTGRVAWSSGLANTTENHAGGVVDALAGVTVHLINNANSTSTNAYGFVTRQVTLNGVVGNAYGLYLLDIAGAINNYGIYTNAGWNHFGDVTSFQTAGLTPAKPNNAVQVLGGSGTGIVSLGQISDANSFGCINFSNTSCAVSNYFIGGNNTDLRLNSPSGAIVLASNNAEKMRMHTNGDIGIFTATPAQPLHVKGITEFEAGGVDSYSTSTVLAATGFPSSYTHVIKTSHSAGAAANNGIQYILSDTSGNPTVNLLTLQGDGTVGIGSTTPSSTLAVRGQAGSTQDLLRVASSTNAIMLSVTNAGVVTTGSTLNVGGSNMTGTANAGLYYASQSNSNGYLLNNGGNYGAIQSLTSNTYGLGTAAALNGTKTTTALVWTTGGNIGIGTTTPVGFLHVHQDASSTLSSTLYTVASTTPVLQLGQKPLPSPSANGTYLAINSPSTFSGNYISILNNGTNAFQVDSTGQTTIGNRLNISGSGVRMVGNSTRIENNNGNPSATMFLGSFGEETTLSSGKLGINTTSPNSTLWVNGSQGASSTVLSLATTAYTITSTDNDIFTSTTTAASTITLPTCNASALGVRYRVFDGGGSAATANITVQRASTDTINGATSKVINGNYDGMEVKCYTVGKWQATKLTAQP